MKVEQSTARKLTITEVPRLDAINVFLEDFGEHRGKLTVSCWEVNHSCFWNAMGTDLVSFINRCGAEYILSNLSNVREQIFTGDALVKLAKKCIVQRRRQQTGRHTWELGELSSGEACELWYAVDHLQYIDHCNELWQHDKLLAEIFGEEWYLCTQEAMEVNPAYTRLLLIVETIKSAVKQLADK